MFLRELSSIMRPAVFAFGRMNPPTTGHQRLVDVMLGVKGDHYLFLSHSQNAKKDPLDFETKVKYAKKFFPKVEVGHKSVKTIIDALKLLEKKGYTAVTFVAGSDRIIQFSDLIKKYNGKEYNFESIEFVSAGERDADSDDVDGMSASKVRAAAAEGNFEEFAKGVPLEELAKNLYKDVREGMQIGDTYTVDT